mmetsp:Transcript_16534/g.19869  ORF Transcript_16534/g.19869 Transcript_16534/m.19869 type:complete len:89 (-) Transcript_16534:24-290(-)
MLLEASRGNSIVICDRAVYRVMKGYFLGHHLEEIPHLQVKSGVLELARIDSGFHATQLEVPEGKSTCTTSNNDNDVTTDSIAEEEEHE